MDRDACPPLPLSQRGHCSVVTSIQMRRSVKRFKRVSASLTQVIAY